MNASPAKHGATCPHATGLSDLVRPRQESQTVGGGHLAQLAVRWPLWAAVLGTAPDVVRDLSRGRALIKDTNE